MTKQPIEKRRDALVPRSKSWRKSPVIPERTLDDGFSLIELLVVLSILAIIATLSVVEMRGYFRSQAHRGAVRDVVAILRNTQVRAVTEATTYQCNFTSTTLKIYRDSASPPTTNPTKTYTIGSNLTFTSISFTHETSAPATTCYFYARGAADPGTLNVTRGDMARSFPSPVEGLTGRVSYTQT
jgi:prepilin-type N-terminal cleavage/methylation domain-containing protein